MLDASRDDHLFAISASGFEDKLRPAAVGQVRRDQLVGQAALILKTYGSVQNLEWLG